MEMNIPSENLFLTRTKASAKRLEQTSPTQPAGRSKRRTARSVSLALALISLAALAPSRLLVPSAIAAEESCASCEKKVTFSGDFVHRRAPAQVVIEGAPTGTDDYYREGIFGADFNATISGLPEGRYTITIGVVDAGMDNTNTGQRVFDISAGDRSLVKGLDIVAAAGGANKVHFVSGTVQHPGRYPWPSNRSN